MVWVRAAPQRADSVRTRTVAAAATRRMEQPPAPAVPAEVVAPAADHHRRAHRSRNGDRPANRSQMAESVAQEWPGIPSARAVRAARAARAEPPAPAVPEAPVAPPPWRAPSMT